MHASGMAAVFAVLVGSAALATEEPPNEEVITIVQSPNEFRETGFFSSSEPDGPASAAIAVAQETDKGLYVVGYSSVEVSPHWIGLGCSAAPEALRAQLGLGETGVVVYDIVEKSPAEAAGIQKHDVLTKADVGDGGTIALKDAPDLVRAVKQAKLKPIKVDLIRSGKTLTLQITPAERPQPRGASAFSMVRPPGVIVDPERVQQFLKEGKTEELKEYIAQQTKEMQAGMRFNVTGPVVAPPARSIKYVPAELPENMTITITRSGKQPPEVKVQIGEDWWKATETQLETLPEEVRGHVSSTLNRMNAQAWKSWAAARVKTTRTGTISGVPIGAAVSIPGPPQLPVTAYPRPAPPADDAARSYEKQLERLEKQIEELRHAVEELTPKN